jgi:hypothetical protein
MERRVGACGVRRGFIEPRLLKEEAQEEEQRQDECERDDDDLDETHDHSLLIRTAQATGLKRGLHCKGV